MISKFFLLVLLFSCAHQAPLKTNDEIEPHNKVQKALKKESSSQQSSCKKQLQYFRLLSKLSKKDIKILNGLSSTELCSRNYNKTTKLLSHHQNKIGIIYTGNNEIKNQAILDGLKKSKKGSNLDMLVKKVPFSKDAINKTLARMVFKKKVGLIVTWGPDKMLEHIQKWQDGLKIPTIYINKKIERNKTAFKMYPNKANYAFEMIKELRKRNIKRIAILTPAKYQKADFIKDIKKVFRAAKIQVVFDEVYNSDSYDSMDMACRRIFVIDRLKRRAEYNAIYRSEKRKAAAQGFGLNKKLVFLPAQVNFDAIFIPDNFKMVNHFVKLFQYYKVRRLPLFGTHEWRSPELVETNRSFLDGSFFIDFISDPAHYQSETMSQQLDYKLMGYYSGLVSKKALKKTKRNRKLVLKKLKKMKMTKKDNAFRRQEFNWPSYAFEIQKDKIIPTR